MRSSSPSGSTIVFLSFFARASRSYWNANGVVGGTKGCLLYTSRTVAVLPGSGDSMFANVHALHADVYVTSDLRHHPATDELQESYYEASMRREGIGLGAVSYTHLDVYKRQE